MNIAHGREEDAVSLFAGLENEYRGRAELFYARGCDFDGEDRSGFREACLLYTSRCV